MAAWTQESSGLGVTGWGGSAPQAQGGRTVPMAECGHLKSFWVSSGPRVTARREWGTRGC